MCWDRRLPSNQQLQLASSGEEVPTSSLTAGDNFACVSLRRTSGRELHCADFTTPTASIQFTQVFDAYVDRDGSSGISRQAYLMSENSSIMCGGYMSQPGGATSTSYMFCHNAHTGTVVQDFDYTVSGPDREQYSIASGEHIFYVGHDGGASKDVIVSMDIHTAVTQVPSMSTGGDAVSGSTFTAPLF